MNLPYDRFTNPRRGFTLIELLVVIAVIGLLATLTVVAFGNARKKARDAKRKTDIVQIQKALDLYYADKGEYPPSADATSPYTSWSNSAYPTGWSALEAKLKPYIGKLPVDPVNEIGKYDDSSKYEPSSPGVFNYEYLSEGNGCPYKFYVLVHRLENSDMPSPGFRTCDGVLFSFPAITIGKRGS